MILERLFGRARRDADPRTPAERLYGETVRQARSAGFYGEGRVPDTVEGRFEALCLHGFLVLHRLKADGEKGRALAQRFFDAMFADMDRNLREIGIGDLAVGKRIKLLAENFYGRIKSYEEGLSDDRALESALARNLLIETAAARAATGAPSVPPFARVVAAYIRREVAALAGQGSHALAEGRIAFGPAPERGV